MKQAIFLLEDSKSAKSIKVPVRSSNPKVKIVFTLWERVPQTSFNLVSYLKSFASEVIDKLFGNENPRYYRSIIINESTQFVVFVWSGDILHEEVVRGLTTNREKLKLPSYNYDDLYQSSIGGYFQKIGVCLLFMIRGLCVVISPRNSSSNSPKKRMVKTN